MARKQLSRKTPGRPEAHVDEHSQQYNLAAQKGNSILDCSRLSITSRLREVILCLCSALVRHTWSVVFQFWAPLYKRDMDIVERVQRRAMKITEGLEHLSYRGDGILLRRQSQTLLSGTQ